MPMKHDTWKNQFCMSSNKFFIKYGLQNNHWFGKSLMKPTDAVVFQKREAIREGNDETSENFEIEVPAEGTLDKVLVVTEKETDTKQP